MPAIDDCDYIVQLFFESGMGMSGASGLTALTWQELESFSDMSGCQLTSWEAEMIMNMSRSYVGTYHKSQEPSTTAPWVDDSPETIEQMRANVAAKFKSLSSGTLPKPEQNTSPKKPRKKVKPA